MGSLAVWCMLVSRERLFSVVFFQNLYISRQWGHHCVILYACRVVPECGPRARIVGSCGCCDVAF